MLRYSFPNTSDIYARLSGSNVFTTLDAQAGFHQIPIDEESSKLTAFLTPFVRFRFKRLPFGITSAPELLYKTTVELVGDLTGVEVYIDDILVHASNQNEQDQKLKEVLTRFRKAGWKLNLNKCSFSTQSVKFLGNKVSVNGLSPSPDKVKAIQEVISPSSKEDVRSFLGMVTYLAMFCPNLSEHTIVLRDLLKLGLEFSWEAAHDRALEELKNLVGNAPVLALFDPKTEVVVNVDASSHSLGAVLLQNGKPVDFAAQSLTPTQRTYAQIEQEQLAILFELTRFHQYVYGRAVKVESDHQPSVTINKKPLRDSRPWLQRMRTRRQHYQY